MSFVSERKVGAVRKPHRCDGCRARLEIGESAIRWVGMTDGDFGTAIYHPDCRAAEIELNNIQDFRMGDDWARLNEIESDMHPWLADEYPAVAERMFKVVSA